MTIDIIDCWWFILKCSIVYTTQDTQTLFCYHIYNVGRSQCLEINMKLSKNTCNDVKGT